VRLLILRHGDAAVGGPDQSRRLSDHGREQVHKQVLRHYQDINAVDVVVSSPYIRAAQTAEIVMQETAVKSIEWLDDLLPHGSLRLIEAFLQQHQASNVMLVSHLPLVGLLIDYLTGETANSMGTASLASLSMDYPAQGLATLHWNHYVD
jgi:phosphohistidine phosphatase SixA